MLRFINEKQSLYVKNLGGFSGGDKNTSGRWTEVSWRRKHRNVSFSGWTLLSRIYLAVKFMLVSKSFPILQFMLLMKTWKLPFWFSVLFWNLSWSWRGAQQQCVLQSNSDLHPQWCSLQGNSPDFLKEFTGMPPLKKVRHTMTNIWVYESIL